MALDGHLTDRCQQQFWARVRLSYQEPLLPEPKLIHPKERPALRPLGFPPPQPKTVLGLQSSLGLYR